MPLDFTRYLLARLAEEASEISQAALKMVLYGVDDQYTGISASHYLLVEMTDYLAVLSLLQTQPDFCEVTIANPFPRINPQDGPWFERFKEKRYKVCQFALYSVEQGTLTLTESELDFVKRMAIQYKEK